MDNIQKQNQAAMKENTDKMKENMDQMKENTANFHRPLRTTPEGEEPISFTELSQAIDNPEKGNLHYAHKAEEKGLYQSAANFYEKAHKFTDAARMYEELNMPANAKRMRKQLSDEITKKIHIPIEINYADERTPATREMTIEYRLETKDATAKITLENPHPPKPKKYENDFMFDALNARGEPYTQHKNVLEQIIFSSEGMTFQTAEDRIYDSASLETVNAAKSNKNATVTAKKTEQNPNKYELTVREMQHAEEIPKALHYLNDSKEELLEDLINITQNNDKNNHLKLSINPGVTKVIRLDEEGNEKETVLAYLEQNIRVDNVKPITIPNATTPYISETKTATIGTKDWIQGRLRLSYMPETGRVRISFTDKKTIEWNWNEETGMYNEAGKWIEFKNDDYKQFVAENIFEEGFPTDQTMYGQGYEKQEWNKEKEIIIPQELAQRLRENPIKDPKALEIIIKTYGKEVEKTKLTSQELGLYNPDEKLKMTTQSKVVPNLTYLQSVVSQYVEHLINSAHQSNEEPTYDSRNPRIINKEEFIKEVGEASKQGLGNGRNEQVRRELDEIAIPEPVVIQTPDKTNWSYDTTVINPEEVGSQGNNKLYALKLNDKGLRQRELYKDQERRLYNKRQDENN